MREVAEFQLWGLYVDAGYRGSHVAATLVCSALQWCRRQRDARAVRTHLRRDDHRVRRLCMRKWFEPVEDPVLTSSRLRAMRLCLEAEKAPPDRELWAGVATTDGGTTGAGSSRLSGASRTPVRRRPMRRAGVHARVSLHRPSRRSSPN